MTSHSRHLNTSRRMSGSSKVCGGCNIKHTSTDLSGPQHLCKECRRTLPQSKCSFCQIDYYVIGDSNKSKPACKKCSEYFNKFGEPKNCDWCRSPSAFKGSKCFQCKSAEEKYGKPSRCEGCKSGAYFDKGLEAKKKVSNKSLCLLCTLKFKKELHRSGKFKRSSAEIVNNRSSKVRRTKDSGDVSSSSHSKPRSRVASKDAETQCDICGHGGGEDSETSGANKDNNLKDDGVTSNLREEVAQLKRQLDTRDRNLIEKGRQCVELKTEMWESEKILKKKMIDLQLEHEKRLDNMEAIMSTIKAENIRLMRVCKMNSRRSSPVVKKTQKTTDLIASNLLMDGECAPSSPIVKKEEEEEDSQDYKYSPVVKKEEDSS